VDSWGGDLARYLLRQGQEVHLLLRPGYDPARLVGLPVQVHIGDVTDAEAVRAILRKISAHHVFHLAAHGAYPWQTDAARIIGVNVVGTINVVQAATEVGARSVVVAGSSSEYGLKDHAPAEGEVLEPNSEYAVGKAAATHMCRILSGRSGIPVTTLRLYSVYGPYEDQRRLIPRVIGAGLHGRLPELASPDIARDFVHVDDVMQAFHIAATEVIGMGEVLNVATGVQTRLRDVADIARRYFGIVDQPEWGSYPDRCWDTEVWVGDAHRLQQLGWKPTVTFEAGFARTADWWAQRSRTEVSAVVQ
jgi:dolichol-phosphate mannosyltransferase